ncbi:hypothetical protein FS842_010923 [Serendipita sp. 407]|nr:hypothetical protein FS842_010923 [Serendipita sp. 407]
MKSRTLLVAGISVDVYSSDLVAADAIDLTLPVCILFVLHGRMGSRNDVEKIAKHMLDAQGSNGRSYHQRRELLVVTFDHRNHGSRLVDARANLGWDLKDLENHNERHALDMYTIQVGTARDVSLLIDFLPSYLFPNNERLVGQWALAGFSLGGHSTWICLCSEPRIEVAMPVVGCPDFLSLMTDRATRKGCDPSNAAHFPRSLVEFVRKYDPATAPFTSPDNRNPFVGKKILAISGAKDRLVPWEFSESFFDSLYVGEGGLKEHFQDEDAGHVWTTKMGDKMAEFVLRHCLLCSYD